MCACHVLFFSADGLAVCEKVVHPRTLLTVFNEAKVIASIPIWPLSFAHSHRLVCSLIITSKLSLWAGRVAVKQITRAGTQLQVRHTANQRPREMVAVATYWLFPLHLHVMTTCLSLCQVPAEIHLGLCFLSPID